MTPASRVVALGDAYRAIARLYAFIDGFGAGVPDAREEAAGHVLTLQVMLDMLDHDEPTDDTLQVVAAALGAVEGLSRIAALVDDSPAKADFAKSFAAAAIKAIGEAATDSPERRVRSTRKSQKVVSTVEEIDALVAATPAGAEREAVIAALSILAKAEIERRKRARAEEAK